MTTGTPPVPPLPQSAPPTQTQTQTPSQSTQRVVDDIVVLVPYSVMRLTFVGPPCSSWVWHIGTENRAFHKPLQDIQYPRPENLSIRIYYSY
jgi:hypothetical protein